MKYMYICVVVLLGLMVSGTSLGTTIYVDQATGNDLNDGLTLGTAVATITQGQNLSSDGDTLDIGPGIYSASNGESFPVLFSGSYVLQGAGSNLTVLDGESMSRVLNMSGSANTVSIQGLAVINGDDSIGGGLNVTDMSSVNLSDCRFENNVGVIGGGLIIFDSAAISITDCQFLANEGSIGGAVQIQINSDTDVDMDINRSEFSNNTGKTGTAINFQENGNGLHTLNVDSSVFNNNAGTGFNFAFVGGTSVSQITNSLFINHPSTALETASSEALIVNNTFADNETALNAGDQTTVVNSIFWDNNSEIFGSGGTVSYSIIQDLDIGGHNDGGGNLNLDPLLDSNHRLVDGSPAIDMGTDQVVDELGLSVDLYMEPRKINNLGLNRPEGVVDIGADEKLDLIFVNGFE